jgi:PEP-CTERM/exosortase A-associated glycosyltransferase
MAIVREQKKVGITPILLTTPRHIVTKQDNIVASDHSNSIDDIDGWKIYRSDKKRSWFNSLPVINEISDMLATYRTIEKHIDDIAPDAIHVHSPVLNFWPLYCVLGKKYPITYEIRAFWEDAAVNHGSTSFGSPRYKGTRTLETMAMKRAAAVTTICNGLKRDILERGIDASKVEVIPNAVSLDDFPPIDAKDVALAQKLGLADNFVLGFIGSFYDYEGLDLLIKALPVIHTKHPNTKLLLVGGGPKEKALKSLIQKLNLNDYVTFTGRVPQGDVRKYYSIADLMVYPRHSMRLTETVTPLKPLEAMAMKRLVLASDVGGHHELIDDNKTGFLFRAGDKIDLAHKVCDISDSIQDMDHILENGRHYVEKVRNWENSVAKYKPIYEKIVRNFKR